MMARLGDIATYINGYAFKPEDWSASGLPIIRIQDLTGNAYQANHYNGGYDKRYEVNKGDVLISWSASLGVYVWQGEKALLNQHIFKVVFDKEEVDKDFFVHQTQRILENAASEAHGATMKHLTKPIFDALPFSLPSLQEQKQVATILNQVDALISLRKKQLQKLDDLVKSRFVEMFGDMTINPRGWEKVSLGSVCDVRDGTHDSPKYYSEGYPLVTSKNVTSGIIDLSGCSLICEADYLAINKRSQVDLGDILMPMIGTVGKPVIVEIADKFAIKNVALIKFYPNSKVINVFVKALLESEYFDRTVVSKVRGGTQKFIALGDIRKLELYLPPIKDQIVFQQYVEIVSQSKLTVQQGLDKLELLKQSLMQKYFG